MKRSEILAQYEPTSSNMLMILRGLQDNSENNHISDEDMRAVAAYLKTTLSQVYGVVTYYSMFSEHPRGEHIIRVCRSPVCALDDLEQVVGALRDELGVGPGMTTEDGQFTVEWSECLGQCEQAPAVLVDQEVIGPGDAYDWSGIRAKFARAQ